MSENNKVPSGTSVISRKMGIAIFVGICVLALGAAILAFYSDNSSKNPHPLTSASPTPTGTKNTSSPAPTVSATPIPGQSFVNTQNAEDPARVLALYLTSRDSTVSKASTLLLVNNLIAPDLVSTIDEYVSSWDWAGCVSSKCEIFPSLYSVSSKSISGGQYLVTAVVTPVKDRKTPLSNKTFIFTTAPDSSGAWVVVAVNSLASSK